MYLNIDKVKCVKLNTFYQNTYFIIYDGNS